MQACWQDTFFAALVETDATKALPLIHRAQSVLESRLFDVSSDQSNNGSELADLRHSLTYLGIISDCVGSERGGFLWD